MTFISAFFPIFAPVFWPTALHRAAQLRSITTITTFYSSSSLEAELGAALTNAAPRLGSPAPNSFKLRIYFVPLFPRQCSAAQWSVSAGQINHGSGQHQTSWPPAGEEVELRHRSGHCWRTHYTLHTGGGRHSNILIAIFLARTSYKLSRKLHNIPTFTTRGYGDYVLLQIVKASKNKRILNIDKKHLSISHSSGSLITGDTSQQHY